MKFVVSSGDLLSRLQIVGRAIASKNTMPILDNFLFSVTGDDLTITASDQEIVIQTTMKVSSVDHDGRVAIPGGKVTEYLKKLPEQPVSFSINDENFALEIGTPTGKNNQAGLDPCEYPELKPLSANAKSFVISSEALLAGISHTVFATANDELRPIMNGVYFDMNDGHITFVATDSHILSLYTRTDINTVAGSSFVLGKKTASLLKNMVTSNETVEVSFDQDSAKFVTANYTLLSRLAGGSYPQYRSVIPNQNPFHVLVNRSDISNAVARVSLFADGTDLVKLHLSAESINVTSQDLDFSCSGQETVPCQYDGENMSIGIKAPFFLNILNNLSSTDVDIQVIDPSRAAIVVPVERKEGIDELMLIMPMKA